MIIRNEGELRKFMREERKRKGLSQSEIAKQLNMSQAYYSKLEAGKRNIDFEVAREICAILGNGVEISPQICEGTCAETATVDILLENRIEKSTGLSIGEMLTGKVEQKSEGKSVSVYLSADAMKNLEKFAKVNGCSKSKTVDLILRNLY